MLVDGDSGDFNDGDEGSDVCNADDEGSSDCNAGNGVSGDCNDGEWRLWYLQ